MRRWLIILGMIVAAVPAFSLDEPELPGQSDGLPSDIEPPLLSQNLAPDDSTLDPRSTSAIEDELARARKRAASADRLFRAGIIAKVEAAKQAGAELWWLPLVTGIIEILLAFWASQSFFPARAELILLWAGFASMFRGFGEIALAFELRRVSRAV